jgi:uncharacterized membrane protein YbhN (UPF0104 family)
MVTAELDTPGTVGRLMAPLRLVAGIGVLAFILSRVDLSGIGEVWRGRTALGVVAAIALLLVAQLVSALRWRAILGSDSLPLSYLLRLYLVGQFFSLFLPTSVGGDAMRSLAAARALPRPGAAISSVVLDRLFGVAALGAYLALGALASPLPLSTTAARFGMALPASSLAVAAAALLGMTGVAFLARRRLLKLQRLVSDGWQVARGLARSPATLLRVALLALVVQGIYIGVWMALARSLGFQIPPSFLLFAVPLVSLVAMLPISFSGLGLREGAWVILLAPFGVAPSHAVVFGLLYFLAFTAVGAIGGIWFIARGLDRV